MGLSLPHLVILAIVVLGIARSDKASTCSRDRVARFLFSCFRRISDSPKSFSWSTAGRFESAEIRRNTKRAMIPSMPNSRLGDRRRAMGGGHPRHRESPNCSLRSRKNPGLIRELNSARAREQLSN